MNKNALVIGGTGPTGPIVLNELIRRGYEPVIFHRGVHEPAGLPDVRHIHGDPHFPATIESALRDEEFDLALCMYGRLKHVAVALRGRCQRLIAVGGVPVYRNFLEPARFRPYGMPVPTHENSPLADPAENAPKFSTLIRQAEDDLFNLADSGAFEASLVRYASIYGPRSLLPAEWSVIKRVQDGRPFMILPDGGLGIHCRCAARNAAELLLRVVDNPEIAKGQVYNAADDDQFTWRQWVEVIADHMQANIEVASLPLELADITLAELVAMPDTSPHTLLDMTKAREQLGYRQVIPAMDAIHETVDDLLNSPFDPSAYPAYRDQFDYQAEDKLVATYRRAIEQVKGDAGRVWPEFIHPMPHPRQPGTGQDEHGR
jgi:nucleoside-diphosphate-sugar epimerase